MGVEEQNSFDKIYNVVRQIPKGKVASYGQIAELAGNRRWARVVGYAMHAIPETSDIPWYRVVKKDGQVFPSVDCDGNNIQIKRLKEEGVHCVNNLVDMKKYQWTKRVY